MKRKPYGQYKQDRFQVFSAPTNHLKEKIDIGTGLAGRHLAHMRHRFYEENADALRQAQEEQKQLRAKRQSISRAKWLKRIGKYQKP